MGRELKRREERKNKNIIAKNEEKFDTSIKGSTLIKLVVFMVLVLLILWYVLAVFVTKEIKLSTGRDKDENESVETSGVNNRILASATFNQAEDVYYVYYYDFSDSDSNINSAISNSELKIYRVDTSSSLNQNYVTEESGNRNVTGINDLKVKNHTLLEITNDRVTGYYEGKSDIISFLGK